MCDVIKIRLKGEDEIEVVEKTPKTEMDNKRIFTTSHMTVPALKISDDGTNGQLQV